MIVTTFKPEPLPRDILKYGHDRVMGDHTIAYVMVGMANAFQRQIRCELNGHKLYASPGMIPLDVRKQYELSSAVAFIARKRVGGG